MSNDPSRSREHGEAPFLKAASYSSFRRRLRDSECARCPLSSGRTCIVVDRGTTKTGIVVVGEAPGAEEDAVGKAFVGRSGRLLDRLFASVGIDSDRHLLIANMVKCRPPGNRAPRREEAAACFPYLRRQIELAGPHTILLLGAVAARSFLGGGHVTMGREAGRVRPLPSWPGIDFVVLYHPAYLLRSPGKRPEFLGHLKKLRKRLEPLGRWPSSRPESR